MAIFTQNLKEKKQRILSVSIHRFNGNPMLRIRFSDLDTDINNKKNNFLKKYIFDNFKEVILGRDPLFNKTDQWIRIHSNKLALNTELKTEKG